MARCGACGKQGLRTTTLAAVIERGKIVGKRIGSCCTGDAILLVATKVAPVAAGNAERKGQQEVLAPFIKNLEARLRGRRAHPPNGPTDEPEGGAEWDAYNQALEDVVALLKGGRS